MLEMILASLGKAIGEAVAREVAGHIKAELEASGIISSHMKEKEELLQEVRDAQSQQERDAILRKLYALLPTSRMR